MSAIAGVACTNCNSATVASYCADCGERQPSHHDFSLRALLVDSAMEITSLDGRLARSIGALLAHPGRLTREWFEGRRTRYVKPFSLFLLLNVTFFVVQPHTQLLGYHYANYVHGNGPKARHRRVLVDARMAKLGITPTELAARFDAVLQDQKKSLLLFDIPVFAVALALLFPFQRRYFVEHIVFSVHAYAFLLMFFVAAAAMFYALAHWVVPFLPATRNAFNWLQNDSGITALLATVVGSYIYLALRHVYASGRVTAVLRTVALFYLIGALTNVHHDVLFYTTLYSL